MTSVGDQNNNIKIVDVWIYL